ncbi:MAG: DNA mismatch repair endonuclease MutL [Simkaniaceae bacterium]|nr:DNA mismatch repair endonuclease MutL [Simkaniaceae bacterium]
MSEDIPGSVRVLSDHTINRIAAGEVIENPAGVVKELVENAIDARGDEIVVRIEGGGFDMISVSDNGTGIGTADLPLCLERYATSKIREADDLTSVLSMGFRGEALAAIVAVSKMTITTSATGGEGSELYAEGGTIVNIRPAVRMRGTTMSVRSLFYNTPARKRFQKSERSSRDEVLKTVTRLALANPSLSIKCIVEGKELISTFMCKEQAQNRAIRIVVRKVLGEEFLALSTPLHVEEKECLFSGFIGMTEGMRTRRTGQYLFINRRSIVSRELSKAIYDGYGTFLPTHRHPVYVLHCTLPTEWVDVNVHPQKKEVRLCETKRIEEVLQKGMIEALHTPPSVRMADLPFSPPPPFNPPPSLPEQEREKDPERASLAPDQASPSLFPPRDVRVIGLYRTFLLLDGDGVDKPGISDGLVIVDLRAAEATIAFSDMEDRKKEKDTLRMLLSPVTISCDREEKRAIDPHITTLLEMGIAIRPFGETTFIVDALSPHIKEEEVRDLIHDLVYLLERFGNRDYPEEEKRKRLARKITTFAKSRKRSYSLREGKEIAERLFSLPSYDRDPTGKSTYIRLHPDEMRNGIKKHFR